MTGMIAGKVAGQPEKCLPLQRSNDMVVIDDDTILFRDGRTTYVNHPLGSCSMLGRGSYALVTRSTRLAIVPRRHRQCGRYQHRRDRRQLRARRFRSVPPAS